jgi:hypothetical protein
MKQRTFIRARKRIPPLFERLKKIMYYEVCSLVRFEEKFDFRCCAEQKARRDARLCDVPVEILKNHTKRTWKNSINLMSGSK